AARVAAAFEQRQSRHRLLFTARSCIRAGVRVLRSKAAPRVRAPRAPAVPWRKVGPMRLRLVSLAIVIVAVVLAVLAWQRNTAQAPIAPAAPEAANHPPAPGEMPGGAPSGMPGGPPTPEIAPPTAADPGIAWQVPSRWVTQIASGMRLATYV